jgi:hypothetical protein
MEFITSFIESIVIHELGDMPSNYTKWIKIGLYM